MLKKLKNIFRYISHLRTSRVLLSLMNNGYLKEIGWLNSEVSGMPVDQDNNPIPWCTYSYIQFITQYLTSDKSMFEFGAGNSTLFYAPKIKKIYSVDNDKSWINMLRIRVPENVKLSYCTLDNGYSASIKLQEELFDIVIVDGRNRVDCIKNSFDRITPDGIVVLDDSERKYYSEGIEFLKEKGFKRIDFWGIAPGYIHNKCTSVFCKDFNSFLS